MSINDHKLNMYTAQHEGLHLSMTASDNPGSFPSIAIHESRHLRVGETMRHPPGSTILLVVAPMNVES